MQLIAKGIGPLKDIYDKFAAQVGITSESNVHSKADKKKDIATMLATLVDEGKVCSIQRGRKVQKKRYHSIMHREGMSTIQRWAKKTSRLVTLI